MGAWLPLGTMFFFLLSDTPLIALFQFHSRWAPVTAVS
jgi:hypothetical protein